MLYGPNHLPELCKQIEKDIGSDDFVKPLIRFFECEYNSLDHTFLVVYPHIKNYLYFICFSDNRIFNKDGTTNSIHLDWITKKMDKFINNLSRKYNAIWYNKYSLKKNKNG